jgi:uncharacterized protein (DUF1800 family)
VTFGTARFPKLSRFFLGALLAASACTSIPERPAVSSGGFEAVSPAGAIRVVQRITWGVNGFAIRTLSEQGLARYLDGQLHPPPGDPLPAEISSRIASLTISQKSAMDLALEMEQRRKDADAIADDAQKKAAQDAYQQRLNLLAREAAARSLLRALYSRDQLKEQMTWFWMNHFNVHQYKANLRVLVGDYEEHAIRPHALGKFRDLVEATLRHPAMIRYLDNEQNAAGRLNENYARELLELHTLGVDGGYTQGDVQELARVLTGVGVNITEKTPNVRPEQRSQYVRDGLFEFNPARHDYGTKSILGHSIRGRGLAEVDEVLDVLCRHPSTARFVSRKIAMFFVADEPAPALVARMAQTFSRTDGDIAAVLRTMIDSPEFAQSLGGKFKDPVHYVISAVRLAYDDKPILNANPMLGWLNRLGEAHYNRQTPDGYPLNEAAWSSPGQMMARFEIARAIGSGNAGLFKTEGENPLERPAFPRLANALYYRSLEGALSSGTRVALDKATSPQEWNVFLLSSPDFMYR